MPILFVFVFKDRALLDVQLENAKSDAVRRIDA